TTASTIQTAPTTVCNGNCTSPVEDSTIITYPVSVPAGSTVPGPTAVKFFDAKANTGMTNGNPSSNFITITTTVKIAIPANTFAGSYTSTLTIAISSGP